MLACHPPSWFMPKHHYPAPALIVLSPCSYVFYHHVDMCIKEGPNPSPLNFKHLGILQQSMEWYMHQSIDWLLYLWHALMYNLTTFVWHYLLLFTKLPTSPPGMIAKTNSKECDRLLWCVKNHLISTTVMFPLNCITWTFEPLSLISFWSFICWFSILFSIIMPMIIYNAFKTVWFYLLKWSLVPLLFPP